MASRDPRAVPSVASRATTCSLILSALEAIAFPLTQPNYIARSYSTRYLKASSLRIATAQRSPIIAVAPKRAAAMRGIRRIAPWSTAAVLYPGSRLERAVGLEPTTSAVFWQRSSVLSYTRANEPYEACRTRTR